MWPPVWVVSDPNEGTPMTVEISALGRGAATPLRKKQGGFGLVEAMVAMLLLAVGLLGIGAALSNTLKNNQSAVLYTQASTQASTVMEVLRGDKSGAVIGRYNLTEWTCNPPSDDNPQGEALARWMGSLKGNLGPDACATISCSNLECSVGVRWNDTGTFSSGQAQELRLTSRL